MTKSIAATTAADHAPAVTWILLTEGQKRALVMVGRAAETSTKKAYTGKHTTAYSHCVRVNALAVRALEKLGLVETWIFDWGGGFSTCVNLTTAGRAVLAEVQR